jgi:hypothetical protein
MDVELVCSEQLPFGLILLVVYEIHDMVCHNPTVSDSMKKHANAVVAW